jgi:hypothetical protein
MHSNAADELCFRMGLRTKLENTMVYIYDADILHNLARSLNDTRPRMSPCMPPPNAERVTKTDMEMDKTSSSRDSLSAPLPHASR